MSANPNTKEIRNILLNVILGIAEQYQSTRSKTLPFEAARAVEQTRLAVVADEVRRF